MSANLFTVIAALPAVLGFGALIFYLFTRYNRSPDPVTLKILDLVQQRAGNLPQLDPRLTGKQVATILEKDNNLRQVFTAEERAILDGVRISERRRQWFAFIFLSGTVILSLILYLVLVWKPWVKPRPHPINHFAVDFSFARNVTPEMETIWKTLKERAEKSLQGTKQTQLNEGFAFIANGLITNRSNVESYKVMLLPASPLWNWLWEEMDKGDVGVIQLMMFHASFFLTDSGLPRDMSQFNSDALGKKMEFSIVAGLQTMSLPLYFELDFSKNRYRVHSSSYVPMVVGVERRVQTWEELAGLNLVVEMIPLNGEGWNLEFVRLHSELGLQYTISGNAIKTHDRLLSEDGKTRVFTAVVK